MKMSYQTLTNEKTDIEQVQKNVLRCTPNQKNENKSTFRLEVDKNKIQQALFKYDCHL